MSFEYPRRQSYSSESNRPGDVELGRLSRAEAAESGSLPATRAGSIISVKVVDDAENKALPIEEPPSPSQFVEGTLQGWLTVCGASLVAMCGSVGGVIYPIILNKIFPREGLGFPWAVRFIAFINIAFLVVANLIMKPRWPTRKRTPVDMSQIIHDPPYWVTIVGILGDLHPMHLFSETHGVDPSFLTWTLPILNAGAAVGRFMPNFLADKYGPLNVIIPSGIISSGMLWALLGVRSVAGVALFELVYGFVSGAFLTLASPAVAAFTRSPTLDDIGLRIGISCFFIGLALLTGNPIAGAVLSSPEYIWWRPLTFACVSSLWNVTVTLG
ncbi:uncharacterized protein ARMOST_12867 [Armillaria ostoyae]|uniref:Major facilitator superfamily (MFS) profile domain-containing protein n=1 Tax=Armillaria ostoyae TaxID=47428 RepID=A0A284RL66_ARMOS|nr:uncharacterized protein ARMOST_12867 [Armillaria ostoyae]